MFSLVSDSDQFCNAPPILQQDIGATALGMTKLAVLYMQMHTVEITGNLLYIQSAHILREGYILRLVCKAKIAFNQIALKSNKCVNVSLRNKNCMRQAGIEGTASSAHSMS